MIKIIHKGHMLTLLITVFLAIIIDNRLRRVFKIERYFAELFQFAYASLTPKTMSSFKAIIMF